MELGITTLGSKRDPGATNFLTSLMQELETMKKTLPPFTQEEGKTLLTEFANSVFNRADEEDIAGLANKGTARTFYAAANFYDALAQFGETDNESLQKKKYAKWKAAEILKAIKDGRDPTPGGFGEGVNIADSGIPQSEAGPKKLTHQPSLEDLIPAAPGTGSDPSKTSISKMVAPAPAQPTPAQAKQPPMRSSAGGAATKNADKINDAKELCRFAMASLNSKDTQTAIQHLEHALSILTSG